MHKQKKRWRWSSFRDDFSSVISDIICLFIYIVGSPIHVKRTKNPCRRQVNRVHEQYVSSLNELFQQNKTKYGIKESTPLIIA